MKNIYDIRKSKQLLYILPSKESALNENYINKKCAVFVCLYYLDTVKQYMEYINAIPNEIKVFVYSSNCKVLELSRSIVKRDDVVFGLKENRGRDISTLLVAASKMIFDFEYVCFMHDKKSNADYLADDVKEWIENLWGNMLFNEKYINNILETFYNNENIGLLVPPEPMGEYLSHWYGDTWNDVFDLTKQLAKEMDLKADIAEDREVFTLGTVFWARTAALKSMYKKEWTYQDFPKEPLPMDGTISHAIERIIGYAAQDMGFDTGTVMTEVYASKLMLKAQEYMRNMFFYIQKNEYVFNFHQIQNLEQRESKLKKYFEDYAEVYIYGAGNYGKSIYCFLNDRNLNCKGFITSEGKRNEQYVCRKPVWEIQEIVSKDDVGIIIGVSYEFKDEIENILKTYGFENFIYGF